MTINDDEISRIASLILNENKHLFPSSYPDIPLNINMLKDALIATDHEVSEAELNKLMISVELKMASIAPLNWNNFCTLAILLKDNFPNEDLLAISPARIVELVETIPNFDDDTMPDEETLDSVIYTWGSLNDENGDFDDDDTWG